MKRLTCLFSVVIFIAVILPAGIHGKEVGLSKTEEESHSKDDLEEDRRMILSSKGLFNISQNLYETLRIEFENETRTKDEDKERERAEYEEEDEIRERSDESVTVKNGTESTEAEEVTSSLLESSSEEEQDDHKFVSSPGDITLEHIDFVMLRLRHISQRTTSDIKELLQIQHKEFKRNAIYKETWEMATRLYNSNKTTTKSDITEGFGNDSIVLQVPLEYHIALIAYTMQYPSPVALYTDFNKKTREVCSGKDVDGYEYKSYFKLLNLAIKNLGKESKFQSANRFLYRGVGSLFTLKEGQILAFQHFISTSAKLSVAENFADKTLFEFQGNYETAVYLGAHSQYAEEEVLFSPLQVFEVESKHVGKYYTRYVLVGKELKIDEGCDLLKDGKSSELINALNGGGAGIIIPVLFIPILIVQIVRILVLN